MRFASPFYNLNHLIHTAALMTMEFRCLRKYCPRPTFLRLDETKRQTYAPSASRFLECRPKTSFPTAKLSRMKPEWKNKPQALEKIRPRLLMMSWDKVNTAGWSNLTKFRDRYNFEWVPVAIPSFHSTIPLVQTSGYWYLIDYLSNVHKKWLWSAQCSK